MPIVLKSGSLNLLEPSAPVQACNGVALPLPDASIHEEIKSRLKLGEDFLSFSAESFVLQFAIQKLKD